MAHDNIEIELRFPLLNPDQVAKFLDQEGELKGKEVYQKDVYYTPAHRDFIDTEYPYEWLRLRQTTDGTTITYKHFFPENAEKTDYAQEYESEVTDGEQIEQIFAALDIRSFLVVEKVRSTWLYREVEIALDRVTDLGSFIELEAVGGFADAQAAKKHLRTVLEELGAEVGPENFRGYANTLLDKLEQSK